MSVTDIATRKFYNCDGAAKNYPIPFSYLEESYVTVKHIDSAGDVTPLILDDAGANGFVITSGEVVTNTLYPDTDDIWLIRETPRTQSTIRKDNRRTPASVDDGSYDKLTMIVQEMEDQAERTIYLDDTTPLDVSVEMPEPVARRVPIWDATGKFLEYTTYDPDTQQSGAAASAAAAADSETAAGLSESNAADSETAAGLSETNAAASEVAAANSAAGVNLPSIQAGDDNKVLQVNDTEDGYELTGTPDINISGNAATATNAVTAGSLVGACAPTTMTPAAWPSFDVQSTAQLDVGATPAKVQFDQEFFDTNSDFDAVTNYRFTPTVAGKYIMLVELEWVNCVAGDAIKVFLYKNGAIHLRIDDEAGPTAGTQPQSISLNMIVDANGSTDYFEVYAANGTTATADLNTSRWTGSRIA